MIASRRKYLGAALGFAAWTCLGVPAWAVEGERGDPFAFVVDLTNRVLDEIRRDPALHRADPTSVQRLVDDYLMPSADFHLMTRMAVGPQWRKADAKQRETLERGFRNLLIRVYSGALLNVKDQKCELRPTRNKTVADEMVIRTLLKSPGAQDIGIDYRIYRNKEGAWRVVDVNVEGIWMVENYRTQFASVLSSGGLDGLIDTLEHRLDALAGESGKGR